MKYTVILALLAITSVQGVSSELSKRVEADAQLCANAVVGADYEALVRFSHPRIVEMMGGKESMIAAVSAGMEQMQSQGVKLVSASVGQAEEPRRVGVLMISIIPQTILLKAPTAKITQESSLLGISSDNGSSWVFLDLGPVTESQFKQIFPELADEVTLPKKKKPIIEEA